MKTIYSKKLIFLLCMIALISLITACNTDKAVNSPKSEQSNPISDVSESDNDKTIIDREGNRIQLPEKTDKIVSLAPSITEVLLELGLGDNIIAVDMYSAKLEGVNNGLPQFDIMSPDAEQIIALNPDIIFATGMSIVYDNDPLKPITDMGIIISYIPTPSTINGIKEDILFLGKMTNTETKAKEIISNIENEIEEIQSRVKNIETKKTLYFEIAPSPAIYSFGKNVYLNEMIEIVGAENILDDQDSWISVSEETVIQKNPDIIITNTDFIDAPIDEILNRNTWDSIDAVKNKDVYFIEKNASSLPNQSIIKGLRKMAKIIYPELFSDYE